MEEYTFKDHQSSLVLGSSFDNFGFSDLKILEDDSSSQDSICAFLELDQNIIISDTLQSLKANDSTGLEGIEFDEEINYTKVVSKKKKSQQKPGVTTHNKVKANCKPPQSLGRKSNKWQRE